MSIRTGTIGIDPGIENGLTIGNSDHGTVSLSIFWEVPAFFPNCIVMGEMQRRVIGWWLIDRRMCKLRIKGRFFNISIMNVHSLHLASDDDDKDAFNAQLEREYDGCPSHDVKIVIGDLNAQVGQEEEFRPIIEKFSAHQLTNENGLRLIYFAASKNMAYLLPAQSPVSVHLEITPTD